MVRLCTALLLICACASVFARDVGMHGPGGDTGSCPDAEQTVAASDKATVAPAASARNKQPAAKATPVTQGGGGEATVRSQGPRWHSFLPGMFR